MTRPIRVLYEDSQAQNERNFGPHVLALRCVCDASPLGGADVWELSRRAVAICLNGVSKLIETATFIDDVDNKVLAPDDDRIRQHLGLDSGTAEAVVVTHLAERCTARPEQIILIIRNMDDVTRAAATALGRSLTEAKPTLRERDSVCHALASDDKQSERARFLSAAPSFARLVSCLRAVLERA